jgi:nicotinamidase-related amidase
MDLIPELDRQTDVVVIFKRQWGAFYGTDLDLQLRRRGLRSIVLCGIATEAAWKAPRATPTSAATNWSLPPTR